MGSDGEVEGDSGGGPEGLAPSRGAKRDREDWDQPGVRGRGAAEEEEEQAPD
jgi:hypothetical protein